MYAIALGWLSDIAPFASGVAPLSPKNPPKKNSGAQKEEFRGIVFGEVRADFLAFLPQNPHFHMCGAHKLL